MDSPAIRAVDLRKSYSIVRAPSAGSYKTLRDDLQSIVRSAFRSRTRQDSYVLNALDGLTFDVAEGDVIGIIGRNGAGKSTLLKVLSRITDPTSGYAEVYGRVGALLEVGVGFHPELTGHENIYLSGTVLGLRRGEITRKLPDIVEFAGVEAFLDTPVKRYSSGMYMRLAFSVAAHLEPEIMIVDEVLAVGDAEFQRKCLGKMRDVSERGRTVLFVSHNMAAIQQMCRRVIVLEQGRIVFDGPTAEGVREYLRASASELVSLRERADRRGSQWLRFTDVELLDGDAKRVQTVLSGSDLVLRFHYEADRELRDADVNIAFNVRSQDGIVITNLNSADSGQRRQPIYRSGFFECRWPRFRLRSGTYHCALFCQVNGDIVDWMQNAFRIEAEDGDFFGTGRLVARDQGDVLVEHSWSSGQAADA
jgi:lipopolysaccharide transport system ATP-binding protein